MLKKAVLAMIAVFILWSVIDYIIHGLMLRSTYEATARLWRPMAEMKTYLFYIVYAFVAFFFTLIFSKGYEAKGLLEGVRYGLYVALMIVLPHAYNSYATLQIPYSIALQWFLYGTVEYVLAGAFLSAAFQMAGDSSTSS